jgi:LysR family transcriptional regulator, hca operon transcriptional activator
MAVALALSKPAICILPRYVKRLLPPTLVSRPLEQPVPMIEMAIGYSKFRTTPLPDLFLSKIHEITMSDEQASKDY